MSLDKIVDGAYATMIERITGMNNPDFFFLSYAKENWTVKNFFFVPKHIFTLKSLKKESPLPQQQEEQVGLDAIFCYGRYRLPEESRLLKTELYLTEGEFWKKSIKRTNSWFPT